MNTTKELMLFVAMTLVSTGATQMAENLKAGVLLLLTGCLVLIGRGFYKKYINDNNA